MDKNITDIMLFIVCIHILSILDSIRFPAGPQYTEHQPPAQTIITYIRVVQLYAVLHNGNLVGQESTPLNKYPHKICGSPFLIIISIVRPLVHLSLCSNTCIIKHYWLIQFEHDEENLKKLFFSITICFLLHDF